VPEGFKVLGHWMGVGGDNPNGKVQTIIVRDVSKNKDALRPPTSLAPIWDDHGSGANHDIEVFAMSAPAGYRSIGTLIRCDGGNGTGAGSVPPEPLDKKKLEQYACLRADLVDIGKITSLLWNDEGSGANKDFSAWGVTYVNPAKPDGSMRLSVGSFVGNGNHSKPEDQRAFVLRFWMPRDPVRLQEWMARASMAR
ncbi:MAG: Vps62-related protein, partial [Planctomycetota bacterium]